MKSDKTAGQLERWLDSDESRSVGQRDGGGESTGHRSGRMNWGHDPLS